MTIHRDILVHWTPRKWAGQPIVKSRREEYVDLLKSIYTKGLLFTCPTSREQVVGFRTRTPLLNFRSSALRSSDCHRLERTSRDTAALGLVSGAISFSAEVRTQCSISKMRHRG